MNTYRCRHCGNPVVKFDNRWLDANNREECRGDRLLHWGVLDVRISRSATLKWRSML